MEEEFQLDVLIVEDNLSFALELAMLVEHIGYNVLARVDNAEDALAIVQQHVPDIILMDNELNGQVTGIELGRKLKHLDIPILYITSFGDDEHYQDAQNSNMIGYLVKPIEKISLRTALELAVQNAYLRRDTTKKNSRQVPRQFLANECLFIKKKGAYHKLEIAKIGFIKSNDNYCEINLVEGRTFFVRMSLSKMEEVLSTEDFMRVHRQFIARLDKIDTIDFNEGYLEIMDEKLPISREKRRELSELLRIFK